MGYVTSSLPAGSTRGVRIAYSDDFTGGVCFDNKSSDNDGKSRYLCNMINDKGVLRTRDGQTMLFSEETFQGSINGYYKNAYCGHVIIHVGTCLYAISPKSEECTPISNELPDKPSIMAVFAAKLYIYCDYGVYSLDRDLVFAKEMPYAPLLYSEYDDLGNSLEYKEQLNIVAPVLSVTFASYNYLGRFTLPVKADLSRLFHVYIRGELLDESKYTLHENTITVDRDCFTDEKDIKISYYAKNPEDIGFEDIFSKLTVAESFGGETISGTRMFMTGNPDFPGRLYISHLLNPLRFDIDSHETVGSGCDDITGLIRQYGRLVMFTKNNVMRLEYSFTDGNSAYAVKELNSSIGCDMPQSIQLIDNRIVFGNSEKGLMIIDTTEDFGEQNIKPLSANINKGHEDALLEQSKEELIDAFSVDFDRKYYLSVGNRVYVWDYGECAYSDSGNYAKAQKRLNWYLFDGVKSRLIFDCGGKLVGVHTNEGTAISVFENTGYDFGIPVHSVYKSSLLDLSYPSQMKTAEKARLNLSSGCEGKISFAVCDSDKEYYHTKFCLKHDTAHEGGIAVKLPKKNVRRLSFTIESNESPFSLESVAIYYRMSHRQD